MTSEKISTFIDALGEGVYGVDTTGRCVFVNASAVRILRYDRPEELIGRNMHEAIHHTKPDGTIFPQTECPLLSTSISGQPVRLENELLWRRDGTSFFAEYSAFPVRENDRITGSIITFAENKVRQDARIRLAVQHAVSQVLAETGGRHTMVTRVLSTVGGGFGWDFGMFWRQDGAAPEALRVVAQWKASGTDVAASAREGIEQTLDASTELAGRAWSTRKPAHTIGTAEEPDAFRLASASLSGSGLAFPLTAGETIFGVFEFTSRERFEVDAMPAPGPPCGRSP